MQQHIENYNINIDNYNDNSYINLRSMMRIFILVEPRMYGAQGHDFGVVEVAGAVNKNNKFNENNSNNQKENKTISAREARSLFRSR